MPGYFFFLKVYFMPKSVLPKCMSMYCVCLVPERSEREAESPGTGVLLSLWVLETKQVLLTTGPSLQFLFKILMVNEVPVFRVLSHQATYF